MGDGFRVKPGMTKIEIGNDIDDGEGKGEILPNIPARM
jgi:hypothetical protein